MEEISGSQFKQLYDFGSTSSGYATMKKIKFLRKNIVNFFYHIKLRTRSGSEIPNQCPNRQKRSRFTIHSMEWAESYRVPD